MGSEEGLAGAVLAGGGGGWWGPRSCNVVLRGSGVDDASENSKPV